MDETRDHPLRIAARALTGALLTEVAVALAVLLIVETCGSVAGSGASPALGHAVGLGLGAAVAVALTERALAVGRRFMAVVSGVTLAPLAALGGWYGLHLADTLSVKDATQAVLDLVTETVSEGDVGGLGLLLVVAVAGYLPPLLLRRRGRGVVEQVARTACALSVVVVTVAVFDRDALDGWPMGGWAALVLVRAAALPVGLALGDAAAARLVALMRGDERAPARGRARPWIGRRARGSLAVLAALLVAAWPFALRSAGLPLDLLLETRSASDRDARLLLAEALISEGVREVHGRDLRRPAGGGTLRARAVGFAWPPRPTAPPPRPLLAGQIDVALACAEGPLVIGLHEVAAVCLEPQAEAGDVDAMLLLAGVLDAGTQAREDTLRRRGWWEHGYVASDEERRQALVWARRAIAAGPDDAGEQRLGRHQTFDWGPRRADPSTVIRSLVEASPEEAVAYARVLAARDGRRMNHLNELLAAHRRLRRPEDDRYLARTRSHERTVPRSWVEGLAPVVPEVVEATASPAADDLARRALEAWPTDPARARALALEALAHDEGHATACLLVSAWHVRAALTEGGPPGHLDVAEQHLAVVERRAPLDPLVLVNGALCDTLRALIASGGDRGWASRALLRLHALAALDPAREVGLLGRVERALRAGGVHVFMLRGPALLGLAHMQDRAAAAARHAGDLTEAAARDRAAGRLRALVAASGDLAPGSEAR